MENIFENAKFGDKFLTRDSRLAIYVGGLEDEEDCSWWNILIIENENDVRYYNKFNKSGLLNDSDADDPYDILSKYQEPIDEEKLDELATKALETTNPTILLNKVEAFDLGFKIGYQKAKEN